MAPSLNLSERLQSKIQSKKRALEDDDAPAAETPKRPKKKTKTKTKKKDIPTIPSTFAEEKSTDPELQLPEFEWSKANKEVATAAQVGDIQQITRDALNLGIAPRFSSSLRKFSPFLHALDRSHEDYLDELAKWRRNAAGGLPGPLLTMGKTGYYDRSMDQDVRREPMAKRFAALASYMFAHEIPAEDLERILPSDGTEKQKEEWKGMLYNWSQIAQRGVFATMRMSTHACISMCTFDYLASLDETGLSLIFEGWWNTDPLGHAMAMWWTVTPTVDMFGIFTDIEGHDQDIRVQWRQSFKIRFLRIMTLIWKWAINIHPDYVNQYKTRAFEIWKELPVSDTELAAAMASITSVEMVPVQSTGHRYANMQKNLFGGKFPSI